MCANVRINDARWRTLRVQIDKETDDINNMSKQNTNTQTKGQTERQTETETEAGTHVD